MKPRMWMTAAVGVLSGALFGGGLVRASSSHSTPPAKPVLAVPFAKAPIVIDGELEDEGWSDPIARTGPFLAADGARGKPYSDARFVVRDGNLYVVLYAADEDIRATNAKHDDVLYTSDAFHLVFETKDGDRVIDVSPRGVVTDGARKANAPNAAIDFSWESHAQVVVDTDGIINDSSDLDEEWVVEMAIPLASLGLRGVAGERVGLSIRRCDEVKTAGRLCSGWGGRLELGAP